jgi:hypothetical protein
MSAFSNTLLKFLSTLHFFPFSATLTKHLDNKPLTLTTNYTDSTRLFVTNVFSRVFKHDPTHRSC